MLCRAARQETDYWDFIQIVSERRGAACGCSARQVPHHIIRVLLKTFHLKAFNITAGLVLLYSAAALSHPYWVDTILITVLPKHRWNYLLLRLTDHVLQFYRGKVVSWSLSLHHPVLLSICFVLDKSLCRITSLHTVYLSGFFFMYIHIFIQPLTVRFMKLRNFFSISVMMEKSPLGRFSLTVVTFIWRREMAIKHQVFYFLYVFQCVLTKLFVMNKA